MDFHELFRKLKEKNRVDLIEPIEDFIDTFWEKSVNINGLVTPQEVLGFIKRDRDLVQKAKKITEEGNLRKIAVKLMIEEFLIR